MNTLHEIILHNMETFLFKLFKWFKTIFENSASFIQKVLNPTSFHSTWAKKINENNYYYNYLTNLKKLE